MFSPFRAMTDKIQTQWLVPILAIFQGRIIDKPEAAKYTTSFSSGSAVEHKVWNFIDISEVTQIEPFTGVHYRGGHAIGDRDEAYNG